MHLGVGEILNIFVLPYIGFVFALVWYLKHRKEDR